MDEKECKEQNGIWKNGKCILPKKYHPLILLLFGVFGYLLGVMGSYIFGQNTKLHHWILGLGGIILSLTLMVYDKKRYTWWVLLLLFSIGLTISDTEDLLHLNYWSYDPPGDNHWL